MTTERNAAFDEYVLKLSKALDRMNYYYLLGVPIDAPTEQIHSAFERVGPQYHPRLHGNASTRVHQAINRVHKRLFEAHAVLSDPSTRAHYNAQLDGGTKRFSTTRRISLIPPNPEDSIRSSTARQFYSQAERDLEQGNFRQAKLNASMAMTREPGNLAIVKLIESIGHERDKFLDLNPDMQRRIATGRNKAQRMALERQYGGQVWQELLENEDLSADEVARIARQKTLPRDLMKRIVENSQWLRDDGVKLALLKNPALDKELTTLILERVAPNERKRISSTPAFPPYVRRVAAASS